MTIKYNLEIRYRGQKAIFTGLELDDEQAADESVKVGEEHNTFLATEHFWNNAELAVMRKEDPPPRRLLYRDVQKGQWLQTQGGSRRGLRANPPAVCDICNDKFSANAPLYDGKTISGPWAWMCPTCFRKHGVGLGVGIGQEYEFIPG